MAEVKRATPALSSLSSNKPPSYSSNGVKPSSSSSSKHIYDDVFASPPQRNLKPSRLCSFLDDDYGEIFGSSKSDDGSWVSACSSVPILELSPESQQARGGGGGGEREIDYSRVFGGFGDDSFGVPDGKELFDQLKKKKAKTSSSASMQRSEGQTPEVPISHICRQSDSGRAQISGFCQSFDVEHFKHKSDGVTAEGATSAAHVLDTPGSTCQLDEGVSSQKTQTGKLPVIKDDTELGTDVSLKKKQKEKYSRNGTFDLAADEQNSVHDACSQKASGFSASVSVSEFRDNCHESAKNVPSKIVEDDDKVGFDVKGDASLAGVSDLGANRKNSEHDTSSHRASVATSHETSQVAGCSNVADIEANLAKIAAGLNVGKKKWRHTRMTSLDFGDHKEARKHDTGFNRKSRLGTSYSFDASHDPFSARIRVQSSKAVPSSSVPQFFPVESHCKILENSSCESSANNPYSCEEQLDVSSAAAVSVAALQRALQEAEMKIRLAKQFLEREGQCSTKWSFKDTLKGKVAKENKHSNDLDEFRPLSFKGALKEKVVKDKKRGNDVKEFQLQKIREDRVEVHNTTQSSHSERQNVDGNAQFTPVFDGQKNSSEDEDPKDGEDSKVSKSIEEGDKHEEGGGEWEAAKPLNQLISGVKNRIASFMTWRADTEKKVESQEIEATKRSVEPSEEIQPDLKDLGISEMKEAENNRCSSISASNSDHEENEIGLIQAASEPKEEESTRCTTLKEDEAGGNVDLIPDFKGSTGESFLHFTFMGESSHNLSAHEGEKKEAQVNRELEFEKRQEPLLNEAKDEQIHEKYEEANREELDGSFMSQHCGNCDEESDGMVEVDYSKAEHEIKEFIQEESYRRLNEQCGEEPTDNSDLPENTIELEEYEVEKEAEHLQGEVPVGNSYCSENVTKIIENDNVWEEQFLKEAEVQQDDIQLVEETNQVGEIGEGAEVSKEIYEWQENERVQSDQGMSNPVDNVTGELPKWGENKSQSQTNHTAELVEHFSFIAADAECRQTEKVFLRTDEEACQIDWGNPGVEEAVYPDEESDRILEIRSSSSEPKTDIESPILPDQESEKMMEMPNPSSEPKMDFKNPILTQKGSELIGQERVCTPVSTENNEQCEGIEYQHGTNRSFPYETPVLQTSETDANCVQKDIGEELMESKPEEILKHHTDHFNAYGKTLNVEEVASVSDEEGEKCRVEAGHRRRRWFENGDEVGATDRPSILEGCAINLETDQEVLEECDLVGSVEIDSTKVNDETTEISNAREANTPLNKEDHEVKVLAPQKRRRWFVNKGEGVPEPPNLFESTTVTLDMDPEIVNESLPNDMSDNCVDKLPTESGDSQTVPEVDVVTNELKDKHTNEAAPRRKRWFENGEKVIPAEQLSIDEEAVTYVEINQESNTTGDEQKCDNLGSTPTPEVKEGTEKVEPVNELHTDSDAVNRKEKERAKERIAVERVIREARERAFAEARERARRDAGERPNAEPRQRAGGMGQDRTGSGKAFAEASSSSDRASMEAKLRVERAAVERATAEARERAMQKALSEKASHKSQEQAGRPVEKNSSMDPRFHSSGSYSRSSHSSNKAEKFDGAEAESPQRHKARLERQNRTMERAAKALEEKNKRDVLAQKEQAARNMLADSLGAEVKRWSCGKEGNLRALLSTLQYILGPESGWQAVSLTDLVAPTAVRKAYKKANLCVHPDKLQQRGASVQQKYICEKVFDLLKEAWSKFNPDER